MVYELKDTSLKIPLFFYKCLSYLNSLSLFILNTLTQIEVFETVVVDIKLDSQLLEPEVFTTICGVQIWVKYLLRGRVR